MSIFYKSDLIITNDGPPIKDGIVEVNEDGLIRSVFQNDAFENFTYVKGIIIPGMVNAHCHLELSHLKGQIPARTNGMAGFIDQVFSLRANTNDDASREAMIGNDKAMYDEGVVAIGDISNSAISIDVKKKSGIHYHTFVEVMGMSDALAESRFENGVQLLNRFVENDLSSVSLALHAPYSISKKLIQLVNTYLKSNSPSSIHINESDDELVFCKSKVGQLKEVFEKYKLPVQDFDNLTQETVLIDVVKNLTNAAPLILVHNVKTDLAEIEKANQLNANLYWCLCVQANEYITGQTPDLKIFNNDSLNVVVGTDSLASNTNLSLLEELKLISRLNNQIPFERLIKWATINGAKALSKENKIGKIKSGYKPGLTQILNINPSSPSITAESFSRRLL
ncbi:MAG: amidohydrolase family protein [Bacteroidota bacterium]|jgi:cytosine/adenosine deaminase-related metal-dependent hydrolase